MKHSGIYKLYWSENSYFYIGQSIDIDKRYKKHLRRLRAGKHENSATQNVFNKYGSPLLIVLEECIELDAREQCYLDMYFGSTECLNICPTASSTKGYKHTNESLIKIGEKSKLKVFTEEYRAKLRGRSPNITMLGKHHTDRAKELISQTHKGVIKTDMHKKRLSDSNKAAIRANSKPVTDILTNKTYRSIKEAARDLGIKHDTLKYRMKYFDNYHVRSIALNYTGELSKNEA